MKSRFEMFMDWIEQALPYGYIVTKGDIIYVYTSPSVWKFNKTDMARFGKISLFHQSKNHLEKTSELRWHKQEEMRSAYYTLFYCFVHDKFKELGMKHINEDYQSFNERFERWYGLQLIKEYFEKQDEQEILEFYEVALNKYVAMYGHTYNTMVGCFLAACREDVENVVWRKTYDNLDEYINHHGIFSCSSYYDYLEEEGLEDEPASQAVYEEYLRKQIHYVVREFNPDNEAHQDILSECNNEWHEV